MTEKHTEAIDAVNAQQLSYVWHDQHSQYVLTVAPDGIGAHLHKSNEPIVPDLPLWAVRAAIEVLDAPEVDAPAGEFTFVAEHNRRTSIRIAGGAASLTSAPAPQMRTRGVYFSVVLPRSALNFVRDRCMQILTSLPGHVLPLSHDVLPELHEFPAATARPTERAVPKIDALAVTHTPSGPLAVGSLQQVAQKLRARSMEFLHNTAADQTLRLRALVIGDVADCMFQVAGGH